MNFDFGKIKEVCKHVSKEGDHLAGGDCPGLGYCLHSSNTPGALRYLCDEGVCPLIIQEAVCQVMRTLKESSLEELQDLASQVIHPNTKYNTNYESYLKRIIAEQRDLGTSIFNIIADIRRGDRK
jgi:hypothetical protein